MRGRICCVMASFLWLALAWNAPVRAGEDPRGAMNIAFDNGDWSTAAARARELVAQQPAAADAWQVLGQSLLRSQDYDGAIAAFTGFAKVPGYAGHANFSVASVHAQRGAGDAALSALAAAAAAGFGSANELAIDPAFAALRDDARFAEVRAKIEANGLAQQQRGQRLMFSTETDRKSARLVLYGGVDTLRVVIDHGLVAWRDRYDAMLAAGEFEGRRWRLGANDWTSLDTNVGLTLGDLEVPAGHYDLTLRRGDGDTLLLELHDAAELREARIDPYFCEQLAPPALIAELDHIVREDGTAEQLAIAIVPRGNNGHACDLRIEFGPHRLSAPLILMER